MRLKRGLMLSPRSVAAKIPKADISFLSSCGIKCRILPSDRKFQIGTFLNLR